MYPRTCSIVLRLLPHFSAWGKCIRDYVDHKIQVENFRVQRTAVKTAILHISTFDTYSLIPQAPPPLFSMGRSLGTRLHVGVT